MKDWVIAAHLCKLHLVHAFSSVPVQKRLAFEHGLELLTDALEDLLDGSVVSNKGSRHLHPTRWNIADSCEDIAWNPGNKICAVFGLHIHDLIVDHLHRNASAIYGCCSEIPSMPWVAGSHHVSSVKHLLSQLRHRECSEALGAAASEWGEAGHEEMEAREWDHVDGQLADISIELAGKSEGSGDTTHGGRDEVVEVT